MNAELKVSVVIIGYNHGRYIGDAVQSVLDQTYPHYELIVLDDGSSDNTRQVVTAFGDKVHYVYQHNQGRGAARNNAVKLAQHDWVAFLDSDDIWLPDKLEKQVAVLTRHPEIDVLLANAFYFDETKVTKENHLLTMRLLHHQPVQQESSLRIFKESLYPYFIDENFVILSSCVVRKECLYQVGLFDTTLRRCQDRDLWLRLARQYRYACLDDILVKMRMHSLDDGPKTAVPLECRVQLFEKAVAHNGELEKTYNGRLHRRLGRSYFDLAHFHFFQNSSLKVARRFLYKSASAGYRPRMLYAYLLTTYLPVWFVTGMRRLKRMILGRDKAVSEPKLD